MSLDEYYKHFIVSDANAQLKLLTEYGRKIKWILMLRISINQRVLRVLMKKHILDDSFMMNSRLFNKVINDINEVVTCRH